MSKYFEIRWHGRGGQGAVTGAKTLAEAVQGTGRFVTAFPEYGPERRGAPLRAFNRFSEWPVRIHTPVQTPDVVMIVDPTLMSHPTVTEGITEETIFVVNTEKSAAVALQALGLSDRALFTTPANRISLELFGREIPNSAMLGAFARACPGLISLEKLMEESSGIFAHLLGDDLVEKNLEALRRGFEEGEKA
jgi:pyruvate ferredoxin oxidoreductase gamma subunit